MHLNYLPTYRVVLLPYELSLRGIFFIQGFLSAQTQVLLHRNLITLQWCLSDESIMEVLARDFYGIAAECVGSPEGSLNINKLGDGL